MYDLIVIGGGPAGITAATTAINKRLNTLIIAEKWGGQTAYTMRLQDTEVFDVVTCEDLLGRFRQQLDYLDFCHHFDRVVQVEPQEDRYVVRTQDDDVFEALALVIATGAKPQRLDVPGAERLAGCGVSYSVVTHGALFLGKDVAVVGTHGRAQTAAYELAQHAHHVHMFVPGLLPEGWPLVPILRRTKNVTIYEGSTVVEIQGREFVEAIVARTVEGGSVTVPVKGVFVKLPRSPNSELVRDWIHCDQEGFIEVNVSGGTNNPGVFAAGDVTHISEHVLVHIGEGAKAAIEAYGYLLGLRALAE